MKRFFILIIFLVSCVVWSCGCVPDPREGDGSLKIEVAWGAGARLGRGLDEIETVKAILTRQGLVVTENLQVNGTVASGSLTGLYAGEWQLRVDAQDAQGCTIYRGETKVTIIDGQTAEVAMSLGPAPGSLELRFDVAPLLAAGLPADNGKVYIYMDPADGNSDSHNLTRDGNFLYGLVEDLPSMTYDARVAVPQVTNAVFKSEFFHFSIMPGQTTLVEITASGGAAVTIGIADQPGQVTGLSAVPQGSGILLTWDAVAGADGYRVYRTDGEGRYVHLALVEDGGVAPRFVDDTFAQAKPYGGAVRYAVAALAGNLEGIRSEPIEVAK